MAKSEIEITKAPILSIPPTPPPGGWTLERYTLDASGLTIWTNEPNTTGFCIRHHNVNAVVEVLKREGDPRIVKSDVA